MPLPGYRSTNFIVAAGCAALMLIAVYYFERQLGLDPCYLCMTQRFFVVLTGAIFLLAGLHNPASVGRKIYAVLGVLSAAGGGYFSGKQLWLQSLPEDKVPVCGPPVEYVMDAFPVLEMIKMLTAGDGNCAEVQWQFLGLSMPGWVLVAFTGMVLVAVFQFLRRA